MNQDCLRRCQEKCRTPASSSTTPSSRRITPQSVTSTAPLARQSTASARRRLNFNNDSDEAIYKLLNATQKGTMTEANLRNAVNRRQQKRRQSLINKYASPGAANADPLSEEAFARKRAKYGTGRATAAVKAAPRGTLVSNLTRNMYETNSNANTERRYPNANTAKRAKKMGIKLTYTQPSFIEGGKNKRVRYTEANILRKIANKAYANSLKPKVKATPKRRSKSNSSSWNKQANREVAKLMRAVKKRVLSQNAEAKKRRRAEFLQAEKLAKKARANAARARAANTKKWKKAMDMFYDKTSESKPKRSYARKSGAAKRVTQKGSPSYDKNVRALAKKLGIKTSYRAPLKNGQKRSSGVFHKTNVLERMIQNKLKVKNLNVVRKLVREKANLNRLQTVNFNAQGRAHNELLNLIGNDKAIRAANARKKYSNGKARWELDAALKNIT